MSAQYGQGEPPSSGTRADGPGEPSSPGARADGPGERASWAPPVRDEAAEPAASAEDVPFAPAGGDTLAEHTSRSWPPPSVHDQRTVASMPGGDGTAPGQPGTPPPTRPWADPSASPDRPSAAPGVTGDAAGPVSAGFDSFGPPETLVSGPAEPDARPSGPGGAPANPFAPPSAPVNAGFDSYGRTETPASGPATPFAPPQQASPANPFAPPQTGPTPYGQDSHVPPPPIAPDGPGRLPYGYPGGGYGYPGGAPQGYYGWPGAQALPSNGMGTAGLVLGVLSALVFCLWPLAIVLGVLGVIFGAIGRGKARRGVATNPGQALAGVICGAAGIALGIGMAVILFAT
ncbi:MULTISPECIES: hypothetical protein [unclassified Streptomyces]|uniref:hypothetical protein n=1 Tax=unclassified Streptomyces TaxID=2593676 RepID=UPI0036E0BC4E